MYRQVGLNLCQFSTKIETLKLLWIKMEQYYKKRMSKMYKQEGLNVCQFSTKIESIKLVWKQRLIHHTPANWKVLPKRCLNCTKLDICFSANHRPTY